MRTNVYDKVCAENNEFRLRGCPIENTQKKMGSEMLMSAVTIQFVIQDDIKAPYG